MTEPTIRLLLRVTARTSFLLFTGAFTGTGLRVLWPGKFSDWVARHRDGFLLGFAASHTIHLGAVIALLITLHMPPRGFLYRVVPGGFVYLLIYALAAALVARSVSAKPLAFIGSTGFTSFAMYTIWVVFASAFVPRMVTRWPVYTVLGAIALASLVVRLAGKTRQTQSVAA